MANNDEAMVDIPIPGDSDNDLIVLDNQDKAEEGETKETHATVPEQTSFHENRGVTDTEPTTLHLEEESDTEKKDTDFLTEEAASAHDRPASSSFLDSDAIQQLDDEYEKALQEREIGWKARYAAVRQNAGLSLWFMACLLLFSNVFLGIYTDWSFRDTLLFSVITITTVGYGNHEIPDENWVLLFICFYIFIGIAILTIMVAQVYQWIVLEVTRARYAKERREFANELTPNQNMAPDDIETPNQEGVVMQAHAHVEISNKSRVKEIF